MGATYTGAFELRRVVLKFARSPTGGVSEDAAAFTLHLAKLTSGAPDANWLTADYTAAEARFDTWWTSTKIFFLPTTVFKGYTWYKDSDVYSPADRANGPPNPAARITARSVAGTSASIAQMPPQVAISITKVVDQRKRWGRMYMLPGASQNSDNDGRIGGGFHATLLGFFVTAFNGCRADGKQPVVFSRGLSAHASKRGGTIPAHSAEAYEITGLKADNIYDVIRSRRYGTPTASTLTNLT